MAPPSTEDHHGSVRSAVLNRSDPARPVTAKKSSDASLTEAQHQANGTALADNAQLHLPSSSTSMLIQWVYETRESKLTWTEKWQQK